MFLCSRMMDYDMLVGQACIFCSPTWGPTTPTVQWNPVEVQIVMPQIMAHKTISEYLPCK